MENDQLTDQNQPGAPGAPFPPAPVVPIPNAAPADQSQAVAIPASGAPAAPAPEAPFHEKFAANLDSLNAANPAAVAAHGGWARSLLAAAVKSLPRVAQGVLKAAPGVMQGMGEAEIANAEHPGESIFGTMARVQQARQAKAQQQEKFQTEMDRDRALTAKTNIDSHYQETLLHSLQGQVSERANAESLQNGQSAVQMATSGAAAFGLPAAQTVAADIGEKELQQAIVNKSFDPTTMTFWHTKTVDSYDPATGKARLDADGNPVHEKRYTIISNPREVVLNKDQAKFLNDNLGTTWSEGQRFPGTLGLSQFQQASNVHAQRAKIDSDRKDAELADLTRDQKLAAAQAEKNLGPGFFHILAQSGSLENTMNFITGQHRVPGIDPATGKPGMVVDPRSADYAQTHPGAGQDLINLYGGLKSYQEQSDKETKDAKDARDARDPLTKMENDPSMMSGDKAPAAIALLQNKLTDPNLDAKDKPRVTRLLVQAQQAQHLENLNRQDQEAAKQAAIQGTPEQAGALLANRTLTLPELKSRNVTPEFIVQATKAAQKYDPTFKAAEAEAQARVAGSANNQQFFGNTDSLLVKGGTLDQLTQAGTDLGNLRFPAFSTAEQWASAAVGNSPVSRYAAAVLGVSDDYAKVMGGSIGTDAARQQVLDIFRPAQSRQQLADAIEQVRQQVRSQREGRLGKNQYLRDMYPDPNPIATPTGQTAPAVPATAPVNIPKNTVHVQIPGQPAGYIPAARLAEFQKRHPNAQVIQ